MKPGLDVGNGTGDFARDKSFTTPGRFVVEQNAIAGMQAVRFAVVYSYPI